jgi:hypothetical protein
VILCFIKDRIISTYQHCEIRLCKTQVSYDLELRRQIRCYLCRPTLSLNWNIYILICAASCSLTCINKEKWMLPCWCNIVFITTNYFLVFHKLVVLIDTVPGQVSWQSKSPLESWCMAYWRCIFVLFISILLFISWIVHFVLWQVWVKKSHIA